MASSIGKRFKQLARKGSSSSKNKYDKFRFNSNEAEKKYTDYYCTKSIVVERYVDFDDEALHELSTIRELERRGWRTFLTQRGQVCEELVREFYANLKDIDFYPDGPRIFSKLRGKDYMIEPHHFTRILQLPIVQHPNYNYGDKYDTAVLFPLISKNNIPWTRSVYPQGELKDEYRILNIVSASSLIPQKRTTDVTVERASLFSAIMTGKKVCARTLIGEVINSHKENVSNPAALPFGLFITACAQQDGIKISSNEKWLSQERAIDATTLNKSTSQKRRKRSTADSTQAAETTVGSSSNDLSERMDALMLTVEQEHRANAEWRDWHRHSVEQDRIATENWREYHRHSIDVMQSEVHQMYYNQQQWGNWMTSQFPGFPPGQWGNQPPPQ